MVTLLISYADHLGALLACIHVLHAICLGFKMKALCFLAGGTVGTFGPRSTGETIVSGTDIPCDTVILADGSTFCTPLAQSLSLLSTGSMIFTVCKL